MKSKLFGHDVSLNKRHMSKEYEDFTKLHKKYYHPSNSYIIIYGNADMEERLAWLDKEYLSAFDAIKIDSELHVQKPFEKMIEKEVEYPVSAQQGLENKTYISYNVAMPACVSVVESWGLNIVTQVLLEAAGAPLKEALLKEKIGDGKVLCALSGGVFHDSTELNREFLEKYKENKL